MFTNIITNRARRGHGDQRDEKRIGRSRRNGTKCAADRGISARRISPGRWSPRPECVAIMCAALGTIPAQGCAPPAILSTILWNCRSLPDSAAVRGTRTLGLAVASSSFALGASTTCWRREKPGLRRSLSTERCDEACCTTHSRAPRRYVGDVHAPLRGTPADDHRRWPCAPCLPVGPRSPDGGVQPRCQCRRAAAVSDATSASGYPDSVGRAVCAAAGSRRTFAARGYWLVARDCGLLRCRDRPACGFVARNTPV